MVDGGRVIRRMRPAPQGRGYRIRKRSNHVTLIVDSKAIKPVKEKEDKVLTKKGDPIEEKVAPVAKKTRTRTKKDSATNTTTN